ncbi:MAG: DUF6525 family protein [Pseudomonadota bacterium]
MREFDGLPAELRTWLSKAVLPWRPRSVLNRFSRELIRTGCSEAALAELDRIERRLVARDVHQLWGADHPYIKTDQRL